MPFWSKKRKVFPTPVDGIFLPQGCTREGLTMIIHREYSGQWFKEYPDKITAVTKMLAFLKSQYPAISSFVIRK